MSEDVTISLRVPEGLREDLDTVADALGTSRSDLLRHYAESGLSRLGDLGDLSDEDLESIEHVSVSAAVEQIKREERPNQRLAWLRSEAASQLWKAWNGGLLPNEARMYLNGRLREAEEVHGDEDAAEYVRHGLAAYERAHQQGEASVLAVWENDRRGRGDAPEAPEGYDGGDTPEVDAPDDRPDKTREERIEDGVEHVREGIIPLETVSERIRDEVAERLEDDDRPSDPADEADTPGGSSRIKSAEEDDGPDRMRTAEMVPCEECDRLVFSEADTPLCVSCRDERGGGE